MTQRHLNEFQELVEQRVEELLKRYGRAIDSREIKRAEVPFYSDEPFWALKLTAGDLELWVYDNELGCSGAGDGIELELADYEDRDDLIEELLAYLRGVL